MTSFGKEFGIGCGDNSCRWGSRGGMATNGGCRCVGERNPREDIEGRMQRLAGIAALRTLASSPEVMAGLRALVEAIQAQSLRETKDTTSEST